MDKFRFPGKSWVPKLILNVIVKVDDIVVREKRKASYHPESSPKKINKVEDMFDIDQVINRKLNKFLVV